MLKEENAELLIDGKRVENDYTFVADDEEMKVEISYTFNASALGGKNLVTFEELYDLSNPDEPVKVAEHKDIEDDGQTVLITERIIKIHTTASGLVQWCYGKAGISLPRTAQAQYDATQHLPLSQAKAGDLVFFHSTYNAGSYVTHVGIYVGNNQMYHAGDPIGYADLSSSYWQQHLIGAGRVKQ